MSRETLIFVIRYLLRGTETARSTPDTSEWQSSSMWPFQVAINTGHARVFNSKERRYAHITGTAANDAIVLCMAVPVKPAHSEASAVQLRLLREAGITRRLARARSLSATVVSMARRAIFTRHPEFSERDVLLRFAETHYGADLAGRVRQYLERSGR